ncbi:MAG: hypothetical protein EBT07_01395 [Actinobacteria bacterium]|nr:hypothetical protein [Actinomycetota bacterium]
MSEVLEVAKTLSHSSDSELERIIGIRLMPSATFKDFFDFASALLKPQNMKGAVAGLTANQIIAFSNLLADSSTTKDKASLEVLAKLFLVQKTGKKYFPLESAKNIFKALVSQNLIERLQVRQEKALSDKPNDYSLIDPLAGIGAFETVQALTELLIELEQRFVPEVGRGGVGLAELKRLSGFLGREVDYARRLYSLAQISGLVVLYQKRWRVGKNYQLWLDSDSATRWQLLAENWLRLLGPEYAADLANETNLQEAVAENFPLSNEGIASHMTNLINLAELIGLTAANRTASWFQATMQADFKAAKSAIAMQLPKIQNKLIVQADLTLISTGPLDTQTELLVRRFAEIERIGVASSYRINPMSLSYAMETGLTETAIRETLKKLSEKELPQPVDYLLRESANRFGRLVLRRIEDKTVLETKEAILITSILNDSEIKALGFEKTSETTIATRFDLELVYYQMRENRYAVIALDENDQIITAWGDNQALTEVKAQAHTVQADIQRWREHEKRLGENPMGEDILRSLELAIKNKATVKVIIEDKKIRKEFNLAPTGLANGRLRGKDKQADCERVLPVANIVSVVLG